MCKILIDGANFCGGGVLKYKFKECNCVVLLTIAGFIAAQNLSSDHYAKVR